MDEERLDFIQTCAASWAESWWSLSKERLGYLLSALEAWKTHIEIAHHGAASAEQDEQNGWEQHTGRSFPNLNDVLPSSPDNVPSPLFERESSMELPQADFSSPTGVSSRQSTDDGPLQSAIERQLFDIQMAEAVPIIDSTLPCEYSIEESPESFHSNSPSVELQTVDHSASEGGERSDSRSESGPCMTFPQFDLDEEDDLEGEPSYFDDAFASLFPQLGVDDDTEDQDAAPLVFSESQAQQIQLCMEMASTSIFILPCQDNNSPEVEDIGQVLKPLTCSSPFSCALVHSILQCVLPGNIPVNQVNHWNALLDLLQGKDFTSNFEVAVDCNVLWLAAINVTSKTIFWHGWGLAEANAVAPEGWTVLNQTQNHPHSRVLQPPVLRAIYETERMINPSPFFDETPSNSVLRVRYLRSVTDSSQSTRVLSRVGIDMKPASLRYFDERLGTYEKSGDASLATHVNAWAKADLERALSERPLSIDTIKALRIFQIIYEIGRPHILQALKQGAVRAAIEETTQLDLINCRHVENLAHIHRYLALHDARHHVAVARTRYIKLSYFQTFNTAVEALRYSLRICKTDRRARRSREKRATSHPGIRRSRTPPERRYVQAIYDTDNGNADHIIKNQIVKQVRNAIGGETEKIHSQITRYLREGAALQLILQGDQCLDPRLFLLFPGTMEEAPTLPIDYEGYVFDERAKKSLKKPLKAKEIDLLSKTEAQWLGVALQLLRPELLTPLPDSAFQLFVERPDGNDHLHDRDPGRYATNPVSFLS